MNNKKQPCADCFAYKTNRCIVLTEMICKTKKCSFYKMKQQFVDNLNKYPPSDDMKHRLRYLTGSENECE